MANSEKSALIEEREQLKLKLTQEEFYCNHLPQRRQMAMIGIVMDLAVTAVWLVIVVGVSGGAVGFDLVVTPILFVFWVIWLVCSYKRIGQDVKLLKKTGFYAETLRSQNEQERLKTQIQQLEEEIDAMPVEVWRG